MTSLTDRLLDPSGLQLPQELRILLGHFVLSHALDEQMDHCQMVQALTKPERKLMMHLGVPRRMGQLAEDLNTQPSTVTAVADQLEAKGMVLRERDPDDRRAWQLCLTEIGQGARSDLTEQIVAQFRDLSGLSPDEMTQLATLMDRVAERILQNGLPKGFTL